MTDDTHEHNRRNYDQLAKHSGALLQALILGLVGWVLITVQNLDKTQNTMLSTSQIIQKTTEGRLDNSAITLADLQKRLTELEYTSRTQQVQLNDLLKRHSEIETYIRRTR
jgi:uncharacterized protein HemX